ncbi:MAG TPA: hypothetical protein PLM06_06575, partial [Anaerolineae bacterium]|nr:hypothetical protein [Anaerolineae bacterium]
VNQRLTDDQQIQITAGNGQVHSPSCENRDQRSAISESAKKQESEKARKITCVANVTQTSVCAQAVPE